MTIKQLNILPLLLLNLLSIAYYTDAKAFIPKDEAIQEEKSRIDSTTLELNTVFFANVRKFKVDRGKLPRLAPNTKRHQPKFQYFWNFRDGSFLLTDELDPDIIHTFKKAGAYDVRLEMTPTKTDDDDLLEDELRVVIPEPSEDNVFSDRENKDDYWKIDPTKHIDLLAVRGAVPGDPLTFIVGYKNNCPDVIDTGKVTFHYNIADLDSISQEVYYEDILKASRKDSLVIDNDLIVEQVLEFEFYNLAPNEQRNLFVNLGVNEKVRIGRTLIIKGGIESNCDTTNFEQAFKTGSSHDPSQITFNIPDLDPSENCSKPTTALANLSVFFLNEGTGWTDSILIDVFPNVPLLSLHWTPDSTLIHEVHGIDSLDTLLNKAAFFFDTIHLRGIKEEGYLKDFPHKDTYDIINFQSLIQLPKAPFLVCARSEVYFDDNPKELSEYCIWLSCCDSIICDTTALLPSSINIQLGNSITLSPNIAGLSFTPDTYQWHPTGDTTANITVAPTQTTMYTFVASACDTATNIAYKAQDRVLVIVNKCPIPSNQIQINTNNASCHNAKDGSISILINGIIDTSYHYRWADTTANIPKRNRLAAGTYIVHITSPSGCTSTQSIQITQPVPLWVDGKIVRKDDGICDIFTLVSGGTPPYSYTWSDGSSNPDLLGITNQANYQLTVTDANGCTYVKTFRLSKNVPTLSEWCMILLTLLLLYLAYTELMKRQGKVTASVVIIAFSLFLNSSATANSKFISHHDCQLEEAYNQSVAYYQEFKKAKIPVERNYFKEKTLESVSLALPLTEKYSEWEAWIKLIGRKWKLEKTSDTIALTSFLYEKLFLIENQSQGEVNNLEINATKAKINYYTGVLCRELGDEAQALDHYKAAIDLLEKEKTDAIFLAGLYKNAAKIYTFYKDFDRSINYLALSAKIHEKQKSKKLVDTYIEWINAYHFRKAEGDLDKMLDLYKKAIQIPNLSEEKRCMLKMAALVPNYVDQKAYDQAHKLLDSCTQTFHSLKRFDRVRDVYISKGDIYGKMEAYQQAKSFYGKALKMTKDQKLNEQHHSRIISILVGLGDVEMNVAKQSKPNNPSLIVNALTYYQKALQKLHPNKTLSNWENPNTSIIIGDPYLIDVLQRKGQVFYQLHQIRRQNKSNELIKLIHKKALPAQLLQASSDCYDLLIQSTNQMKKRYHFEGGHHNLSQLNKKYFLEALEVYYQLMQQDSLRKTHYLNKANHYMSAMKAISLKKEWQKKKASDYLPKHLITQENSLNQLRWYYYAKTQTPQTKDSLVQKAYQDSLSIIKNQLIDLNSYAEKEFPAYKHSKYQIKTPSIDSLQKELAADQGMLNFFMGEKVIYILGIHQQQSFLTKINIEEHFKDKLTQLAQHFQEKTKYSCGLGYEIYSTLLAPVLEKFPPAIKRLVIIPDDILYQIPFNALPIDANDDSRLLSKYYAITYADDPAFISAKKQPSNHSPLTANIFAPDYSNSPILLALPNAQKEAQVINDLLDGQLWQKQLAQKRHFLKRLQQSDIIHFSGHAFGNEQNGLESYLVFSPETTSALDTSNRIYAYELYNLRLESELVVLSACETQQGNFLQGEGVISLSRAFRRAGAAATISILWSADDEATQYIMVQFYEELQAGYPKDIALQIAQQKYLDSPISKGKRHPYYWAGIVLMGSVEPLDLSEKDDFWLLSYLLKLLFHPTFLQP